MSGHKPLVFDPSRGLPREVAAQEPLQIPGPLAVEGGVGFHGTPPPGSKAPVGGDWGESLAAVVEALIAAGLLVDLRPQDWAAALASIRQLSHLGPYQVGRVVVGSVNGWAVLDQPLGSPGELQALIAGAGAAQTLPGGTQAQGLGYATVVAESAQEPLTVQRGSLWADSANKRFWIRTASGWVEITQYLPDATTSSKGLVQLADSAAIHAGTAGRVVDAAQLKAFTPPDATDAAKGVVQLADAAAITAGTAGRVVDAAQLKAAAAPDATDAVKGLVQLANAAAITAGTAGRVVDAAQLKAAIASGSSSGAIGQGTLQTTFCPALTGRWPAVCWSPEQKLFVAVCDSGSNQSMWSTDGYSWTYGSGMTGAWIDVCWSPGNNAYLALSNTGVTLSSNGKTWGALHALPDSFGGMKCCWASGLGLYVACGSSALDTCAAVAVSSDGITWTMHNMPSADASLAAAVCWAPELNLLVAVGGRQGVGLVWTSPDGEHWTLRHEGASSTSEHWLTTVCWSPKLHRLVAGEGGSIVGPTTHVLSSDDGTTWTPRALPAGYYSLTSIVWSDSLSGFTAVGELNGKKIAVSADGLAWAEPSYASPVSVSYGGICAAPDRLVAVCTSPYTVGGTVQHRAVVIARIIEYPMLPLATTDQPGIVQLASTTAIASGTAGRVVDAAQLKAATPAATTSLRGLVQLADAAAITAGAAGRVVDAAQLKAAAAPDATDAVKGLVQLADAAAITAGTAGRVVDAAQLKAGLSDRAPAAGALVGSLTTPERTITAGAFDLATGPYWTCGAIAIPNPTNAVSGMSGLIRLTAAPTSWAANFKFKGGVAPAVSTVPAIVPFYVESTSVIRMGQPVVVG